MYYGIPTAPAAVYEVGTYVSPLADDKPHSFVLDKNVGQVRVRHRPEAAATERAEDG